MKPLRPSLILSGGAFPQSRDSLGYLPLQLALKARLQRATKALVGGMASFTAISSVAGLQGCAFCSCLSRDSRDLVM